MSNPVGLIFRFILKLTLGLFAAVFALSLLAAALVFVALNLLKSLLTGRKPAPAMVFGRFQQFSPQAMWPEARSAVVLAMRYGNGADPLSVLTKRQHAAISCYAQGADYHDVIKPKLKRIAGWLAAETGADVKVFVDTAPLMEKPLAAAAGLGWQGKHTNLVSRQFGSWLFLGSIFTTLDLATDAPEEDHCGTCRACLDICPTAAFPAPYQLDARRCIS